MRSFSFICHGREPGSEAVCRRALKFEPDFDYGCASIEDDFIPIRLPASRLQNVLEGYMSLEDMKKYLES